MSRNKYRDPEREAERQKDKNRKVARTVKYQPPTNDDR